MRRTTCTIAPARVLSVRCPWASLICRGLKNVENRSWSPPRTLPLPARIAIHASAKAPDAGKWQDFDANIAPMIGMSAAEFRKLIAPGCIIGSVVVASAYHPESSPTPALTPGEDAWYEGEWGWRLTDARLYRTPIGPVSGRLNLWTPDERLAAEIAVAERSATPMPFIPPLVIPERDNGDADDLEVLTSYWDAEEQTDYTAKELRLLVERGKMPADKADRIRASGPVSDDQLMALYDERDDELDEWDD